METRTKNFKACEICDSNATSLCFICKNYFCEQCYKFVHEKQKNINHKKESIDPFIPIDLKCPEHPEHSVCLFCTEEKGKIIIIIYINYRNVLPFLFL